MECLRTVVNHLLREFVKVFKDKIIIITCFSSSPRMYLPFVFPHIPLLSRSHSVSRQLPFLRRQLSLQELVNCSHLPWLDLMKHCLFVQCKQQICFNKIAHFQFIFIHKTKTANESSSNSNYTDQRHFKQSDLGMHHYARVHLD